MNRGYLLLVLFSVSLLQVFGAGNSADKSAGNWELINEDSGIQVLERWVTEGKNMKVKERTGRMTLNCSVDEIIDLIESTEKTPLWMTNAEKVKRLKTVNDHEWYVHTILDTPWPFNKQDMVSKYVIYTDANNITHVKITKDNKLLPPQKDIDRLDTFNAEWVIKPINNNKVRVTFTTHSTKPPKYPSWAQDPVIRRVFFNNLKNFKSIINKA